MEIWKPHPEYKGIEVSTLGRVRTLDRVVASKGNGTQIVKGRVLKQHNKSNGYSQVGFHVNGKAVNKLVHRLVAQTFLPNPDNLPQVNHKDCDRKNNKVENLEFCTPKYNSQYREKYGISQTEAQGQPLFAINLTTLEVLHFRSRAEASRVLGLSHGNISNVIKGRYKSTGSFWFTSADDNADDIINRKLNEIGKAGLTDSTTNELGAE